MIRKTLKDFEFEQIIDVRPDGYEGNAPGRKRIVKRKCVFSYHLKQMLIEDIKEIRKNGFDTRLKILDMPIKIDPKLKGNKINLIADTVSRKMLIAESDLVVRYLIRKFNISEGDLK